MELLILSRESSWDGGVVNLVSSVKAGLSKSTHASDFIIGSRGAHASFIRRYLQPFVDAWHLFRMVRREQYDVVHINPSLNTNSLLRDGLFMLVLRITGQRVLVFFHGWDESLSAKICDSRFRRWLVKSTFGYAKTILVLAGSFRDQLTEMGVSRDKISVITTMFDGTHLKGLQKPAHVGNKILFLSRFVPEKGLFELIEAFKRISREFPDARMVMAGDGPARDELEQAINDTGLSATVMLPGYLRDKDKVEVLADADIFVLPTYYGEGCPVSMLEAMAAGLALISTPVGGIPDILHDGKNGILLESADPDFIYQALHNLMSSPDLLKTISDTNREIAWRCYESGVVTAKIEEYYLKTSNL